MNSAEAGALGVVAAVVILIVAMLAYFGGRHDGYKMGVACAQYAHVDPKVHCGWDD